MNVRMSLSGLLISLLWSAALAQTPSLPPQLPEGDKPGAAAERTYGTDKAVQVTATVQAVPSQIVLNWPAKTGTTSFNIYRKSKDDASWGTAIDTLVSTATTYTDTNVTTGTGYEYMVRQGTSSSSPQGYVYAGIQVPVVDYRGKIILLVAEAQAASLAGELDVLKRDLIGDGWQVIRHNIAASATVPDVKALIQTDYTADPTNVKAVYIIGHVPVPYSGNQAPDGHSNHVGAWAADVFYGDMDGTWTDTTVNNTSAGTARNRNIPGDGKYDQTYLSGANALELAVGRVDLYDMPAFAKSETELLRQYLNKSHNFKSTSNTVTTRALVRDGFTSYAEGFSQSGWRLASLVGTANLKSGLWADLITQDHLWAYGCGGGSWDRANGISTTTVYAVTTYKAMFNAVFGSYFGDFDCRNNFLRAPLGNPTYGLINAWAGRPHWFFHHMGLGETTGFAFKVSTLSSAVYASGTSQTGVHIALMGDPSLRLQYVAPAKDVGAAPIDASSARVFWSASSDPAVMGYHVYRASDMDSVFTRLTPSPVSDTSFTDTAASGNPVYMVRAVKLQITPSGTYYNQSIGAFSGGSFHGLQTAEIASDGHFYVGVYDFSDANWSASLDTSGGGQIGYPFPSDHWILLCLYDYAGGNWAEGMYTLRQALSVPAPTQLLSNPGFEDGDDGNGVPVKWRLWAAVDGTTREVRVVDDGRQGKGVRIRDDVTDGSVGLIQEIAAVPGQKYRFGCWKKGSMASLYIKSVNAQGTEVKIKTITATNTNTAVYEQFSGEDTATEDAVLIRVMLYSALAWTGTFVVDDVSLEKVD